MKYVFVQILPDLMISVSAIRWEEELVDDPISAIPSVAVTTACFLQNGLVEMAQYAGRILAVAAVRHHVFNVALDERHHGMDVAMEMVIATGMHFIHFTCSCVCRHR